MSNSDIIVDGKLNENSEYFKKLTTFNDKQFIQEIQSLQIQLLNKTDDGNTAVLSEEQMTEILDEIDEKEKQQKTQELQELQESQEQEKQVQPNFTLHKKQKAFFICSSCRIMFKSSFLFSESMY